MKAFLLSARLHREMLYCIRLDEMMSRIEETFLYRNQRTGDNEMDNLQVSVGKKDIFSVQSVTQATAAAAAGLLKSSSNLYISSRLKVSLCQSYAYALCGLDFWQGEFLTSS